jgi:molybdenum cofactor cytidylyltransferase/nicotine blue oxidoreductase
MGRPKAEIEVDGRRLVDRAVEALGCCDDVLVVGRPGLEVVGARVVHNPDPERGMRSSLQLAVDATDPPDSAAAPATPLALAVMLVDTPGVGADAVAAVVAQWRRHGRIAVASYAGRRGHPTVMSRPWWSRALELAGPDEGARALLARHPELVDEVDVPGDPRDLDRPADLARWRGRPG